MITLTGAAKTKKNKQQFNKKEERLKKMKLIEWNCAAYIYVIIMPTFCIWFFILKMRNLWILIILKPIDFIFLCLKDKTWSWSIFVALSFIQLTVTHGSCRELGISNKNLCFGNKQANKQTDKQSRRSENLRLFLCWH